MDEYLRGKRKFRRGASYRNEVEEFFIPNGIQLGKVLLEEEVLVQLNWFILNARPKDFNLVPEYFPVNFHLNFALSLGPDSIFGRFWQKKSILRTINFAN